MKFTISTDSDAGVVYPNGTYVVESSRVTPKQEA